MKMLCLAVLSLMLQALLAEHVQLSAIDKSLFVKLHNAARAVVGSPKLEWSDQLAEVAAAWGANCEWKHSNGEYGENLYTSWPRKDVNADSISGALRSWIEEKAFHEKEGNWGCMFRGADTCGHYTQVVWRDSRHVGCAIVHCPSPMYLANFVVCEYDPSGNWYGEDPY